MSRWKMQLVVAVCALPIDFAAAANFSGPAAGGSWATPGNWTPATVPNAVSATADFPANAANRTVTVDSGTSGFTVGAITINTGGAFTNAINTGTSGSKLILDNGGSGAKITSAGAGTGRTTFNAPLVLNETVTVDTAQTGMVSTDSLNFVGGISGTGGFIKNGDNAASFGTNAKTYTGTTTLNNGRMRISSAAAPTSTSSFTINSGGQLELISAATYALGTGALNLNGAGPTTGQFSPFPGAIRPSTGLIITISNPVNLQSDAVIHVQGAAAGSLTLSGVVNGVGQLTFTAANSNNDIGKLTLTNANGYSGGTLVQGGTLVVSGASATLGTGNVTVNNAASVASVAVLSILSGVSNAIADGATLSLAGGAAGMANLGAGVNDLVGSLVLGGVVQTQAGTYGSTSSGAMFQSDTYFSGSGVVSLAAVPEASAFLCVGLAAVAAGVSSQLKRRRSSKTAVAQQP